MQFAKSPVPMSKCVDATTPKSDLNATSEPFRGVPAQRENPVFAQRVASPLASTTPVVPKAAVLERRNIRHFINDLTDEQKQELLDMWTSQMKAKLQLPKLSVNEVARLLQRQHNVVTAGREKTNSLSKYLSDSKDSILPKLGMAVSKLTAEEKKALMNALSE